MLLRLRVVGPGSADELRPRLKFAMEEMIRELAGPDVELSVSVELPTNRRRSARESGAPRMKAGLAE
jgi:hypothetical protein